MKRSLKFVALIITVVLSACSSGPQSINYDEDECHRCKMIISDTKYGAEAITKKGKVFKYDAIECLIPSMLKDEAGNLDKMYVTDYNNPKTFLVAQEASYLISENLPSPMGGFLTAFANIEEAIIAQSRQGGKLYTWKSLVEKYKNDN